MVEQQNEGDIGAANREEDLGEDLAHRKLEDDDEQDDDYASESQTSSSSSGDEDEDALSEDLSESRASEADQGENAGGRSAEPPPRSFAGGETGSKQGPASERPGLSNPVRAWYRCKKRWHRSLGKGLRTFRAQAVLFTMSPSGRWSCRGSKSLLNDPAFPVIERQLQRLAMSQHELRAARDEIFQNETQRRRAERGAAREPEQNHAAQNQRQPSKVLRTKARRICNSLGFQKKLAEILSANGWSKPCSKAVCSSEHLMSLEQAPCYPLRQALGWPASVPFTSAVGELSTLELAEFVTVFHAFEVLQPMHEEAAEHVETEGTARQNCVEQAGKSLGHRRWAA
jgi:hypothetical protein